MSKKHFFGFAALEISFWCFHACFICYASAYFLDIGISSTAVSLLLAGYMLCAFIGSIVWGSVCDALGTNKRVFLIGVIAAAALMFLIYASGSNLAVLAIAYPLLGFFFLPQSANAESWILAACDHDQKIYGQIRSTPSFVYAFCAALIGRLITFYGYGVMVVGAAAFAVCVVVSAIALPDCAKVKAAQRRQITVQDYAGLLSNTHYRKLIVLLFLSSLAFSPVNNLKIIILERVGGNVSHVGLDSFACAMTQVPFFLFAGLLSRIPLRVRYAVMTGLPVLMIAMCMEASAPMMVIAGSVAFNAGYGMMIPTMREVTERYVPEHLRNLGHSLSDSVQNSFAAVISLSYAGVIVDGFGVRAMLALCLAIAVLAFAVSLFGKSEKTKRENEAHE